MSDAIFLCFGSIISSLFAGGARAFWRFMGDLLNSNLMWSWDKKVDYSVKAS